jgi:uncharacterized protein YaaQ
MKMVMAVVPRDEAKCVLEALVADGFTATFAESRGGMLRQAQHMLFIAVKSEDLDQVLSIVKGSCHSEVQVESSEPEKPPLIGPAPKKAELGGAVVLVWDLDRFEIY